MRMNLINKRIVITRPRERAEEFAALLTAEGAEPVFFPVIQISPLSDYACLDEALRNLEHYDWLILTSVHGVDAVIGRMQVLGLALPHHVRVAAVGTQTAMSLSKYGVIVHFVPTEYTAESIAGSLQADASSKRFLLPQSNLARDVLAKELRNVGGVVDEVVAYHTMQAQPDPSALEALRSGVDVITFASPSSVKGFADILDEHNVDIHNLPGNPLIACIGQVTTSAVKDAGLQVDIEAQEHTIKGLIEAMKEYNNSVVE